MSDSFTLGGGPYRDIPRIAGRSLSKRSMTFAGTMPLDNVATDLNRMATLELLRHPPLPLQRGNVLCLNHGGHPAPLPRRLTSQGREPEAVMRPKAAESPFFAPKKPVTQVNS